VGSLVDLGGHVQRSDASIVSHDERVDLEVNEVEIAEKLHQGNNETSKVLAACDGNFLEELLSDSRDGGLDTDAEGETDTLGVDISDIDTSLVVEENLVVVSETLL
jgi:hypothetical protein